jgi:hypothetical protein
MYGQGPFPGHNTLHRAQKSFHPLGFRRSRPPAGPPKRVARVLQFSRRLQQSDGAASSWRMP